MTTSTPARPSTTARAERRLLVQLSVAAVSMLTLAASWLGIMSAERAVVAQPTEVQAGATTTNGSLTSVVPAPATSNTTVVRRSRAS